jgi:hypothetical protein
MPAAMPSSATRQPSQYRLGLIFLGTYLLLLGLIALFTVTAGGHMSSLLLVFPALPWPLLGKWLLGYEGFVIGIWSGLALNAVLAFVLGLAVSRLRNRPRAAER